MSNIKKISVRFNLDKIKEDGLWCKIEHQSKINHKSINATVKEIIRSYFMDKSSKDDILTEKIVSAMEKSLTEKFPEMLSAVFCGMIGNHNAVNNTVSALPAPEKENNENISLPPEELKQLEEIAADKAIMDFLGG